MAEVKHRPRLYFQVPVQPSAKLDAQLAQAIESTEAGCVLLCGDDQTPDENHLSRLVDLVQSRAVASLIENDIGLAERLGADGVHLPPDPEIYRNARARLGESANIGVGCGLSRHDAMSLAEMGADYIAFGPPAGTGIDAIDQCADLIAWWADLFVVPCVAWNVGSAADAERFAACGADFVAPSPRLWYEQDAQRIIAEIDNAVRRARRTA